MMINLWLNLEQLAGFTAGVKRTYHQLRRGAHPVNRDRHTFIYLGHLDRLRLAREYIAMTGCCDERVVARLFTTPWENSTRMTDELLSGHPDPFEPQDP
jgi:hypothetical protein